MLVTRCGHSGQVAAVVAGDASIVRDQAIIFFSCSFGNVCLRYFLRVATVTENGQLVL